ncbi:MAG: 16S rRNA (guanine(527)-N(7))-methyltransferase RsmG [Alphaproteobacteria bacterium]
MQPEQMVADFGVSRETLQKLKNYAALVVKWQKTINLVGHNTLDDVWERHFADSAQLAHYVPEGGVLADLGSGAGFPGLVLAMLRPDITVHLVESDTRKAEFLRTVSRETDTPIVIHNERAEKILQHIKPTLITARAFAPAIKIMGLVTGARIDAKLLLLKGKKWRAELREARKNYEFSAENAASSTDRHAQILTISQIRPIG